MRSLYLMRSHGSAGIDGEQVVVSQGGEELERIRLPLLDQILVMGNIQLGCVPWSGVKAEACDLNGDQ